MASSITLQRATTVGLRISALPSARQSFQSQTLLMRRLLLRSPTRATRIQHSRPNSTKPTSSSPPPPAPASATPAAAAAATARTTKTTSRLDRIVTRTSRYLPERLREPLRGFRHAPISHMASFLILHELTAIIPLFGLTGAFYYLDILPIEWVFGWWAPYVQEEGTRVLRYFKKKGWFGLAAKGQNGGDEKGMEKGEERLERELAEREGEKKKSWFAFLKKQKSEEEEAAEAAAAADKAQQRSTTQKALKALKEQATWDNTEAGYKLGVQIVAAYAITKMLLIPRVAFSLWLTPSFARAMVWSRKAIFRR
ncbi:hypothetical protein PG999_012609 [Apiospora kogelbergensis]|uniref:Uncharacterized protein n=1 Tax=Apiospora kogelbergensis TaxID=1337665 RepID=A0AAW0Q7C1_9PEZI